MENKASSSSAFFNLSNCAVGAGIVGVPFAFEALGVMLALVIYAVMALAAMYSLHILALASEATGATTYEGAMEAAFGKRFATLVKAAVVVYVFGILVGYVVIVGDLLPSTAAVVFGATPADWDGTASSSYGAASALASLLDVLFSPAVVQATVCLCAILPLCMLRRMDSLRFASMLALAAVLYFTLMVVYRSINSTAHEAPCWQRSHSAVRVVRFDFEDFFFALPILAFALGGHLQSISIYSELDDEYKAEDKGVKTWNRIVAASVAFLSVIYMAVGLLSYMCLVGPEDESSANILKDLLRKNPYDVLVQIAGVAICGVVVLSYPLMHFSMRQSLDMLLFSCWNNANGEPFTGKHADVRYKVETCAIVGCTLLVAVLVGDLKLVFGLIGATGSVCFKFVLPALLFLQVGGRRKRCVQRTPAEVELVDMASQPLESRESSWEAVERELGLSGDTSLRHLHHDGQGRGVPELVLSQDGLEGLVVEACEAREDTETEIVHVPISRGHKTACLLLMGVGTLLGGVSTFTVLSSG